MEPNHIGLNQVVLSGILCKDPEDRDFEYKGEVRRKVCCQIEFLPYPKAGKSQKVFLESYGAEAQKWQDFKAGDRVEISGRLNISNYKKDDRWFTAPTIIVNDIESV